MTEASACKQPSSNSCEALLLSIDQRLSVMEKVLIGDGSLSSGIGTLAVCRWAVTVATAVAIAVVVAWLTAVIVTDRALPAPAQPARLNTCIKDSP